MRTALLTAGMVVFAALDAGGQLAHSIAVGGGASQLPATAWMRDTRVASTMRLDRGPTMLGFDVEVLERAGDLQVRRSILDGSLSAPLLGPARLSLGGRLAAGADAEYGPSLNLLGPPRSSGLAALSVSAARSGAWLGASVEEHATGGASVGAWRSIGNAVFTLSSVTRRAPGSGFSIVSRIVQRWDTVQTDSGPIPIWRSVTVADTTRTAARRFGELEARLDWAVRRVQLTAVVAGRARADSLRANVWGRLNASMPVGQRIALVGAFGLAPTVPATPSRMARFGMVGVRLTRTRAPRPALPAPVRPAATGFAVERATEGGYRFSLRVPAARTVELSGDFSAWRPVALTETRAGTWEVTLPVSPGTHRVNVRVNGEGWVAPPGLPAMDDEFNGRVGLLVIR